MFFPTVQAGYGSPGDQGPPGDQGEPVSIFVLVQWKQWLRATTELHDKSNPSTRHFNFASVYTNDK